MVPMNSLRHIRNNISFCNEIFEKINSDAKKEAKCEDFYFSLYSLRANLIQLQVSLMKPPHVVYENQKEIVALLEIIMRSIVELIQKKQIILKVCGPNYDVAHLHLNMCYFFFDFVLVSFACVENTEVEEKTGKTLLGKIRSIFFVDEEDDE